jgi:hypothetical protein
MFDSPKIRELQSLVTSPNVGSAAVGDSNYETAYLVANQGTELRVRTVPQRSGSVRYAVDQMV